MNHYDPATPRVNLLVAAVAMTALTLGLFGVMPAATRSDSAGALPSTFGKANSQAPTVVIINPPRIEVVAEREKTIAMTNVVTR